MSSGEIFYLCLVGAALLSFIGGLGFISVWSRSAQEPDVTPAKPEQGTLDLSSHRNAA